MIVREGIKLLRLCTLLAFSNFLALCRPVCRASYLHRPRVSVACKSSAADVYLSLVAVETAR